MKKIIQFASCTLALGVLSPSVWADTCPDTTETVAHFSPPQFQKFQADVTALFDPRASAKQADLAALNLGKIKNARVRQSLAETLPPEMFKTPSWTSLTPAQKKRIHALVDKTFATAVAETEKTPRFFKSAYHSNLAAIPNLAQAKFQMDFQRDGGRAAKDFSAQSLMIATDTLGGPTIDGTMKALRSASDAALSAQSPEQLVKVTDAVIAFMREEALASDRSAMRAAAMPILDICRERLTAGTSAGDGAIARIDTYFRTSQNVSPDQTIQALQNHPKVDDWTSRPGIKKHVAFAESSSPVLHRLAASYYSSLLPFLSPSP